MTRSCAGHSAAADSSAMNPASAPTLLRGRIEVIVCRISALRLRSGVGGCALSSRRSLATLGIEPLNARHLIQYPVPSMTRHRQQQPGNRPLLRIDASARLADDLAAVLVLPRGSCRVVPD